jgi:hypothetical protein
LAFFERHFVMHFLIGTAIVLGIVYLLVVSSNFRKAAAILVMAVIAGSSLFIWIIYSTENKSKSAQESPTREDKSVTAIKPGDLDLTDVSLTKQSNGEWALKGTIANNSEFDLASVNFLVTVRDCPQQQDCKIIGQERTVTNTSIIPSHQVRLFNAYPMIFLDMPAAVHLQWEYKITLITAKGPNPFEDFKPPEDGRRN